MSRRIDQSRPDAPTRVCTEIQLTSHVLPPSSENDCSRRYERGVMSDKTLRARLVLPLECSRSKNSPRPFLNSPIAGWLRVPSRLFAKTMLHWRSEEHTSELQSLAYLVCRLLLEKKKNK